MSAAARCTFACALAAAIAGCAPAPPRHSAAAFPPGGIAVLEAAPPAYAIAPGRHTKSDVQAALGATLVLKFDSGYEVWVYRLAEGGMRRGARAGARHADPGAEFVVLFAPSGIVAKTRVRPAPAPA